MTIGQSPVDTVDYVYDAANRLTQADGQSITYDNAGRMTDDSNLIYTWDKADRLLSTTGATTTRFLHGPRGIFAHEASSGAWG